MSEIRSPADAFNPFDGPSVDDPGPVLALARAEEPIFFSPVLGSWVVTRYDDVVAVLRDPDRFSSHEILSIEGLLSPEVAARFGDEIPMEGTLIGLDPPVHTRLRRVLQDAFTPRRVAGMEPEVRALANHFVDGFADPTATGGEVDDLLTAFCFPFPLTVILRLIGIPEEELTRSYRACQDWNRLSVALMNGVPLDEQLRLADSILDFHHYLLELIAERARRPADDLISALVAVRQAEHLTDRELLSLLPGLVFAGHETTANLIGNAMTHLLATPDRWKAVCAGELPVAGVVEEALRYDGPVVGLPRVVAVDTELGGVLLRAGQRLYVSYWSANRDERRFSDAGEFCPGRQAEPHVAFGRGIHFCIGAPLARLEAKVALQTLAERLPGLTLADGFVPAGLPHFFLRGFQRLPVRWQVA